MKKILCFICLCGLYCGICNAAVRDGTSAQRGKNTQSATPIQQRVATTPATKSSSTRIGTGQTSKTRNATQQKNSTTRTAASKNRTASIDRGAANRNVTQRTQSSRSAVAARAATEITKPSAMSETRTGAEYEQCKNAYFTCMDQFCKLKSDDYRRCSCSDRVYNLTEQRKTLQDAGEQLTVFTENLDAVGMTAAQAAAMRNPSEGENALTADKSASKALLQAIMNSIRGEDASVGGKYSSLNSINMSFDSTNAFGMTDAGQAIAAYNGKTLYSAVYPQCRSAVRADCNDASLQRAVTAYLMAVEQDCNTVQTAINTMQKQMKASVRESSAMLDLARVENRQKHNSDHITTCINNVEAAILSEEVCGHDYHKCLDNGEFIDVSTGEPIAGVENFYELEQMLSFAHGVEAANQKLAKNSANRVFVSNFENRVKKFAAPALDKCTEQADFVWSEYLDKAMLDIYYAQRAKVAQIKEKCFDYVATCYANNDTALTAATKDLTDKSALSVQPDKIALSNKMCSDYINSCNAMFNGNIIADYANTRKNTDVLTACRAVVKQCFDNFGGTGYQNFYYPNSGLFAPDSNGDAIKWFSLYEYDADGKRQSTYVSQCAKQLQDIESCNDPEIIEKAFGGLDLFHVTGTNNTEEKYYTTCNAYADDTNTDCNPTTGFSTLSRDIRPVGVATEVYNQIISTLITQCENYQGKFLYAQEKKYEYNGCNIITDRLGTIKVTDENIYKLYGYTSTTNIPVVQLYNIKGNENICPRGYEYQVDMSSWGMCSCWANGGRRSKDGTNAKCIAGLPTTSSCNDQPCDSTKDKATNCNHIFITGEGSGTPKAATDLKTQSSMTQWCINKVNDSNQVCYEYGADSCNTLSNVPKGTK